METNNISLGIPLLLQVFIEQQVLIWKDARNNNDFSTNPKTENAMRRLFLLVIAATSLTLQSQTLQHPARLTAEVNGTPKESPLEIRDGDSVSLAVTSDFEISEVEWLLKMKGIDGDCWEKALSGNAEGCRFIMQYSLFTLWNSVNIETMFPCTTDPATMDVLNEGWIVAKVTTADGSTYEASLPVFLNVLPKKPILTLSNYREVCDANHTPIPVVDVEIQTERYETLFIAVTSRPWALYTVFEEGDEKPHEGPYMAKDFDGGDMGCGYICWAANRYGAVASDTIRLGPATGLEQIQNGGFAMSLRGNTVALRSLLPIQKVSLYNMHGQCLLHEENTTRVEATVPSGIYLLKTCINGKEQTRKLFIR